MSDAIYCGICYRVFSQTRYAVQHSIFAHGVRYPYWVYFYKGLLADPWVDMNAVPPRVVPRAGGVDKGG